MSAVQGRGVGERTVLPNVNGMLIALTTVFYLVISPSPFQSDGRCCRAAFQSSVLCRHALSQQDERQQLGEDETYQRGNRAIGDDVCHRYAAHIIIYVIITHAAERGEQRAEEQGSSIAADHAGELSEQPDPQPDLYEGGYRIAGGNEVGQQPACLADFYHHASFSPCMDCRQAGGNRQNRIENHQYDD